MENKDIGMSYIGRYYEQKLKREEAEMEIVLLNAEIEQKDIYIAEYVKYISWLERQKWFADNYKFVRSFLRYGEPKE